MVANAMLSGHFFYLFNYCKSLDLLISEYPIHTPPHATGPHSRKFDSEIIWKFCVIGCYSLALLITHFISFEVQGRLSKLYSIHNKSQSWHLTNDHSRMVEIISIRNYAFHDPMPGHQLNILWQNAISVLYIFDHQRVNISLGSILERFIPTIKGGSLWYLKLCQMRVLAI